jgi:hypothetical protein
VQEDAMAEGTPDVTLGTLHGDLTTGFADLRSDMSAGFVDLKIEMRAGFADLKGEMRAGFADLKRTLVVGFSRLPTRESSEEMVRLLREGNRLEEGRFTQLDLRIREQHLETQQVLHALVQGQRLLIEGQQGLSTEIKGLSASIKALITRIDALIRGRNNGEPSS